jgi:tetratricopeptide (TPR) repeat protein
MRFVVQTLTTIVVTLGVVFAAATVHADPLARPASASARNHLALGNKLYGIRSFDQAIEEYKAGALVESAPVFDYNLAQCFRQLGKYQEAIWHYQRFLTRGDPKGELLDAVNDFLTQMKSELDRKAMNQPPNEPGSEPTKPVSLRVRDDNSIIQRREPWYRDRFGLGLAGVGVIGLALGGGLLIDGASVNREANANLNQQASDKLHDKANTRNLLGTVIGIGGAGLLVTGIIKLALHHEVPSRGARWGLAVSSHWELVGYGTF